MPLIYEPEPIPLTAGPPELQEFLARELARISEALAVVQAVTLEKTHIAPPRPEEGMIVYADGVLWNPGGGEGYYGYMNGNWIKIDNNAGAGTASFGGMVLTSYSGLPISGLIPGSTFGSLIQGMLSGHIVIGVRDNDNADSFSVVSFNGTGTYAARVASFLANGDVILGVNGTAIDGISTGFFSPTTSALVNLDAASPPTSATRWTRIDNIVQCVTQIVLDPTATGACSFELSLPIASNFTAAQQLGGVFHHAAQGGVMAAQTTNDTAFCSFTATSTAAGTFQMVYSYQVL